MITKNTIRGSSDAQQLIIAKRNSKSNKYMSNSKTPDGLWAVQKAKLKLRFSHLNDDDFRYDYGKKDAMMTRLQLMLGKSREGLNRLLVEL